VDGKKNTSHIADIPLGQNRIACRQNTLTGVLAPRHEGFFAQDRDPTARLGSLWAGGCAAPFCCRVPLTRFGV
jgi:hypothetical protein